MLAFRFANYAPFMCVSCLVYCCHGYCLTGCILQCSPLLHFRQGKCPQINNMAVVSLLHRQTQHQANVCTRTWKKRRKKWSSNMMIGCQTSHATCHLHRHCSCGTRYNRCCACTCSHLSENTLSVYHCNLYAI